MTISLTEAQREAGYYFGDDTTGCYLMYCGQYIAKWVWRQPSQKEVDEIIAKHQAPRQHWPPPNPVGFTDIG